jgi:hypothetical protein
MLALQRGRLAVGQEFLVHLGLNLDDELLDPTGVDPAILDQVDQCQPRDLTAYRLETREDHCFRGVVDDEVDSGGLFEGADIPSLATDDPTLHLVRRKVHDTDRALDDVLRSDSLDRHGDHAPRLLLGLLRGFVLDALDHPGSVHARLVLHGAHQFLLRLVTGEAGDLLEFLSLQVGRRLQFTLALGELDLPRLQILGPAGGLQFLGRQRFVSLPVRDLFILQSRLEGVEFDPVIAGFPFKFHARLEQPFPGADLGILVEALALGLGPSDDAPCFLFGFGEHGLCGGPAAAPEGPDHGEPE